MRNTVLILGITIGLLILLAMLWLLFVVTGAFSIFMSNPPKPKVVYGEFPISVTFEIGGEIQKVEDIIVCQFDGFETLGTAGKYRKWKSHLKSNNTRITLMRGYDENLQYEICVSYGLPEYYMGDLQNQTNAEYENARDDIEHLSYIQWKNGIQTGETILKAEAWEKYKLKLINIVYSLPLNNSFE